MSTEIAAPSAYRDAALRLAEIQKEKKHCIAEHTKVIQQLDTESALNQEVVRVAEAGFDPEQFVIAREILAIQWPRTAGRNQRISEYPLTGSRRALDSNMRDCLSEARSELRVGVKKMLTTYYGIKSYDQWSSQRNDSQYGYGPTHGSIWFSIGMQRQTRAELNQDGKLTDAEVIACVNWLSAIEANPELL